MVVVVGWNRKLKYSRNRFLGRAKPSKPFPLGIGRARLVNTESGSWWNRWNRGSCLELYMVKLPRLEKMTQKDREKENDP
ncbi:hypothetical protein E2C01_003606 [Portunus trituberculatus]|uniref:Uncharacterized protein n=1 Tax=Portunus trituberculatus TaxID=210409 RepID=A0A5B7CN73_PORTR|nr:hypothetical protein [Portunus trituberculatus]